MDGSLFTCGSALLGLSVPLSSSAAASPQPSQAAAKAVATIRSGVTLKSGSVRNVRSDLTHDGQVRRISPRFVAPDGHVVLVPHTSNRPLVIVDLP